MIDGLHARRFWKLRWIGAAIAACLCSVTLFLLTPAAKSAWQLLSSADDPVALTDARFETEPQERDGAKFAAHIEAALAENDTDLAKSYVALAQSQDVLLDHALVARVNAAAETNDAPASVAGRFARGFVTGHVTDGATLAGTVTGDLFVFGDIRDVVREGAHIAKGEEPDKLILGLASAGIAVTAATYAMSGTTLPLRAGLTVMKDARRAGRIGEGLSKWLGRSAREVVDNPAMREAVQNASLMRPAKSASALRAAFDAEKAGVLVRVAKDVGRIRAGAGTRAAIEGLKIAEAPADVARLAKLAEKKPTQMRALMKLFGRGAIVLGMGAFNLAMWLGWTLMALFGLLAAIKGLTERSTEAYLRRKKVKRLAARERLVQAAMAG